MTAISTQTTEALRQAAQLVERDQALAALVNALDPGRTQSRCTPWRVTSSACRRHTHAAWTGSKPVDGHHGTVSRARC
jgi:hypothetical protein